MHDNLSQIGRAWVATSLLNNIVPSAPLQDSFLHHAKLPTDAQTFPQNLSLSLTGGMT
jgi:hypothetical protein